MGGFIVICIVIAIVVIGLFPHAYPFTMTLCGVGMAYGCYMIARGVLLLKKRQKSAISSDTYRTQRWAKPAFDPKDFETQTADIFRAYGYNVVETPYQGDHGVDLKVFKENEYAIVQCKRHTKPIGEPIVRDFFGAMQHEGADHGFIITTARFTENAYRWAKGKRIILVDGMALQKMLDETSNMRGAVQ